jgi:peptide/nickel transport system substrate-binding protein
MAHTRKRISGGLWNRREVLQSSAATALWGLFGRPVLAAEIPNEFDGANFRLEAPEPNAKRGGILRYGVTMRPPHFDIHQGATVNNIGAQGCMFDNLIRRDPRDGGQTIIPDLAHSWEISKDGKTYTFHLRKAVEFHDGAELSSDDVKATFDRIARPPPGINMPRRVLFSAVSEIAAPDRYTVQFKLSEPRPPNFMMSAIACGWNVIVRKQTLEDNHYDLRRVEVYPGTGPFKSVRRAENEIWVMERNPNYWNKGLPYLDGIEFYHALPFSPELGAAVLSGQVDYVRLTDSVTARKAAKTPGMATTAFNQSVVHAICINNKRKPFDDPRVRRALHLALDRPALIEVVKDISPMRVGGFIYPFSDFATPEDALFKRPGYQSNPAAALTEARALLAAAGRTNGIKDLDFLVREGPIRQGWAQAVQAMLSEQLNIETNLRTVHVSIWFADSESGNFDLSFGVIASTLLDPSDYFNAWYRGGGPQNYSFWNNKEFNALLDEIDRDVDPAKRLAKVRQAEAVMEQDPPTLPVAWEKVNDVWYEYVKGHRPQNYFGTFDVVRLDTFWLDK